MFGVARGCHHLRRAAAPANDIYVPASRLRRNTHATPFFTGSTTNAPEFFIHPRHSVYDQARITTVDNHSSASFIEDHPNSARPVLGVDSVCRHIQLYPDSLRLAFAYSLAMSLLWFVPPRLAAGKLILRHISIVLIDALAPSRLPAKHLATYFRGLCEEYGGFVSLNLGGLPVFLIGDIRLAKEILEKRSAKFSSRRSNPYVRYHHFEALLNMTHLLDDGGKDWFNHMDRVSASMVLTAAFGLHCPTGQEPDLKEIIACNAETYRKREDALYNKLITRAVSGEASGMNTWAAVFASEDKPEGDQRRLMNQFTVAAIETTAVSLHTFILACMLYPEWIPRAQREIDAVVGEDRLPSFNDRPRLPYVEAIVRETLRWRPALRFGIPHHCTADDVVEYKGKEYFIPKGSIIFAVSWAIEHDQERFENHDLFQPERFLDNTNNLKAGYETSAFGFGRRVCPGIPFAERSLWINIAMMLWIFNILIWLSTERSRMRRINSLLCSSHVL
ncbi:Steroid 17-alpha-hydroxylase/17,20 lyase [Mycena sanguinolenta]|uniref:Steroid 17-alpha-hydroxylase/17,20 lyase n=1 Tax=Mycena sanguinolenta TaxID=230812 RepID=A0A8H6Z844_9AGAR|nr:Steroid 17-alpha-hydroxylase/17,20 lyase [Mycena sanguinolenta]